MYKKVVVLTFIFTFLFSSLLFAQTQESYFTDINKHWAKESIIRMYNKKIISGYKDGTFKPDNRVTYAEFNTMLVRAIESNLNQVENNNSSTKTTITVANTGQYQVGDEVSVKVTVHETPESNLTFYPISYGLIKEIQEKQVIIEVTNYDLKQFNELLSRKLTYEVVPLYKNKHWAFDLFKIISNSTQEVNLSVSLLNKTFTGVLKDISFNNNFITEIKGCYLDECQTDNILDHYVTREQVARLLLQVYANVSNNSEIKLTMNDNKIFYDSENLSNESKAVRYAVKELGIFSGTYKGDKLYFSDKEITRAEALVVIERFINLINLN